MPAYNGVEYRYCFRFHRSKWSDVRAFLITLEPEHGCLMVDIGDTDHEGEEMIRLYGDRFEDKVVIYQYLKL